MLALRSAFFLIVEIITLMPFSLLVLMTFPFSAQARFRFITYWPRMALYSARLICGIRHQVIGAENIPTQPHIIMCKHSSTWETLVLPAMFPPQAFVAKRELLYVPFFGWGFALASPITIDRQTGSEAMQQIIDQGRKRRGDGFWIVIFPEGTRIPVGKRVKYKTGGARLAIALDMPILPMAHNAGYLWPRRKFIKKPGMITLSIGKPISPTGREMAELIQEIEDWIEGEVARLGPPATEN